jgi:hypothetical protein
MIVPQSENLFFQLTSMNRNNTAGLWYL